MLVLIKILGGVFLLRVCVNLGLRLTLQPKLHILIICLASILAFALLHHLN